MLPNPMPLWAVNDQKENMVWPPLPKSLDLELVGDRKERYVTEEKRGNPKIRSHRMAIDMNDEGRREVHPTSATPNPDGAPCFPHPEYL